MEEPTTAHQRWNTFDNLHRHVSLRIDRQVNKELGINTRDYRALVALKDHSPLSGPPLRSVINATGLSASATSRLLTRLSRRGLISIHEGTSDRRTLGIDLTPEAVELVHRGGPVVERVTTAVVASLNPGHNHPHLLGFLRPESPVRAGALREEAS
ncbi:MarR family winged helix-turn-helix transcriptional regulator [Streptomyces sp. NPDC047706]|uniref:MarR family winged helix-turn-helix transcriptional regulator n=1 Tax=Streptomyces sp. NPDC047706 TaxID=3365486 RepID=UPI00371C34D2